MADIITQLLAMDDAALMAKIGLNAKLDAAKKNLAELNSLTGEARTHAIGRLERQFQPNVYPEEWSWIKEDAQRHACRSAKEEMCDCDPESIAPR